MWIDILSNFIGAFFGFLFAVLVEIWVSKKDDKDLQAKVKNNIINELSEIRDSLSEMKENNSNPLYFRYHTVAWDTCVNSGYLFSVSGKPIYNTYVKIYTKITFANDIEKQFFDLKLKYEAEKDISLIYDVLVKMDETRKERRTQILEEILQLCNTDVARRNNGN